MLPSAFIASLEGLAGFEKESFIAVHEKQAQVTSVRINQYKEFDTKSHPFLHDTQAIPWCNEGRYLEERPFFVLDPLWHAGAYYVQEASSMFLQYLLTQLLPQPGEAKVLDLCAAPGGKTTLLANYFKQGLVVANETIKSRNSILVENVTKWGADHVVVTQNDPVHFKSLPQFFDLMLIDAPCSGSGLFRKDPSAIGEWSLEHVQHCSVRQARIVEDSIEALKDGGYLVYATCSYSKAEDEAMMDHIANLPGMKSISIEIPADWNIVNTYSDQHQAMGFRAYPNKIKGEGFFIAVFQKMESDQASPIASAVKLTTPSKNEQAILSDLFSLTQTHYFITHQNNQIAIPVVFLEACKVLLSNLYVKKIGLSLGEIKGKDFIPSHALAVSDWQSVPFDRIEVDLETALQYLRRAPLDLEGEKGWNAITYSGIRLGWVKLLPNRLNNYYPNEWRILNY